MQTGTTTSFSTPSTVTLTRDRTGRFLKNGGAWMSVSPLAMAERIFRLRNLAILGETIRSPMFFSMAKRGCGAWVGKKFLPPNGIRLSGSLGS